MEVSIRFAIEEDALPLAPLLAELGFAGTVETLSSRLKMLLRDQSKIQVVALASHDDVVGFLSAEMRLFAQSGAFCEVVALVVAPSARRCGVARTLVEHVEEWATSCGVETLRVRSSITRSESHKFYVALGFTQRKTQHCYIKGCTPNNSFKPSPLRGLGPTGTASGGPA